MNTDNTEVEDRTLLEKRAERREKKALALMAIGCSIGLAGYWMFLQAGGSLISSPSSNLWIAPSFVGSALAFYGFWLIAP